MSAAELSGAGLDRGAVRRGELVQVRRGVWTPYGVPVDDPDVRIAAVASQLPDHAVIGGWAAARLHERAAARDGLQVFDGAAVWDEPDRGSRRSGARELVCARPESRLALRPDVRVFRSGVADDERGEVAGVPVTSALRTAFDAARLLPRTRAVIGLDRLLHLDLVDPAALSEVIRRRRGWRGEGAARRSLMLADGGSESPQETVLRLTWIDAGLPRPRANAVVRDGNRVFIARVDLLDEVNGVVGEYDGAFHADSARRSDDARRQEEVERLGHGQGDLGGREEQNRPGPVA